jgi:hypothetical protein
MLNSLYKNDFMPISITSISINNQELIVIEPNKSVSWFRSFMHYCIDNRREQILHNHRLEKYFKLSRHDVSFGRAIHYNRVEGYEDLFFHNQLDIKTMIRRISIIALDLNLEVEIQTAEF